MPPNSKPAYPEKMIAIATFQNLVLDKTPQKEIARQNRPHVQPSFGNTWNHKITLLNPILRPAIIEAIPIIPNLVFGMQALVTMFNIWKQTSITVLFSRIIAAAATITGLKWFIFFAITMIIGRVLNNVLPKLVENMIARFKATKENSILDDLAKKHEWWKGDEGKTVYERYRKSEAQLERDCFAAFKKLSFNEAPSVPIFEETAGFAYKHAKTIPADTLKVHIWDDKFSDMVEIQPRKGQMPTLELADKQICSDCSKHVDKIANAIIGAQATK